MSYLIGVLTKHLNSAFRESEMPRREIERLPFYLFNIKITTVYFSDISQFSNHIPVNYFGNVSGLFFCLLLSSPPPPPCITYLDLFSLPFSSPSLRCQAFQSQPQWTGTRETRRDSAVVTDEAIPGLRVRVTRYRSSLALLWRKNGQDRVAILKPRKRRRR